MSLLLNFLSLVKIDVEIDFILSVFDIIIFAYLILGIYRGFKNGYLVQSMSLFAFFIGLLFIVFLVKKMIFRSSGTPDLAHLIIFTLLFALVVVASELVGFFIKKVTSGLPSVPFIGKIMGGTFGLARHLFIASVVMIILFRLDANYDILPNRERIGSKLAKPVSKFAPLFVPFLRFDMDQPVRPPDDKTDKDKKTTEK